MNSLLYTSKARGKYNLKNTLWQNMCLFHENTHLLQLLEEGNALALIYVTIHAQGRFNCSFWMAWIGLYIGSQCDANGIGSIGQGTLCD